MTPSARRHRSQRLRLATAALTVAVTAALGATAATAGPSGASSAPSVPSVPTVATSVGTPGVVASDGAFVQSEVILDPQTVDLTISSPALGGTTTVRLWLPAHWATAPAGRRWPTLYLLHGANDPQQQATWTVNTQAKAFMAGRDVLTVMPAAGAAALYSDPWNFGRGGGTKYETYHTRELPQLIEGAYRGKRSNRAVLGISAGGLGAFKYAAKNPGFFSAAASLSGLVNTSLPPARTFVQAILVQAGVLLGSIWGDPIFQFSIWQASNPYYLAPGLTGIPLFISSGNGAAGPLDCWFFCVDPVIEPAALLVNTSFAARARSLGLDLTTDFYGAGTHHWPYWSREFPRAWPTLAKGLGVPV